MPIISSSDQKSKTLEEFYGELLSDKATIVENEIGKTMLSFISMVNNTFIDTILFGLTSHYSLVIQRTDNWRDDWFVRVNSIGDKKFQFKYQMPEAKSPWKYAIVYGEANDIEEAKNFLIIAMKESEGWEGNRELRQLYNKLQDRKTGDQKFSLWLEFEEINPNNWDIENEFCNIHIDLEDGRHYGLTIWTYKFLETAINDDKKSGQSLHGLYQKPPDLFVKELTRECIEKAIQDLMKIGDLERVLNQSIYNK